MAVNLTTQIQFHKTDKESFERYVEANKVDVTRIDEVWISDEGRLFFVFDNNKNLCYNNNIEKNERINEFLRGTIFEK